MHEETKIPPAIQAELRMLRTRVAELEHLHTGQAPVSYIQEAQQLRSILNSLGDIVWSQDPATWTVLYISPAVERIYGYPLDAFRADASLWLKVVHPDDVAHVEAFFPRIMAEGSADLEYRIIRADGEVRWLHDKGTAIHDPSGAIIRIDGLATDVTARKQFEAEREQQRQQTELIRLQDQTISTQRETLRELSAPLIPLDDGVVAMPLIGIIDAARAQQILETLLLGITAQQADIAIIDITGVTLIDIHVADGLLQTARAARLLGAEVVLTGINPEVAQTLVGLDTNLHDLVTRSNLRSGIAYALERQRRLQ